MLKESSAFTSEKGNIIKMYLEKKGFSEILNLVIGADFGNKIYAFIEKIINKNNLLFKRDNGKYYIIIKR